MSTEIYYWSGKVNWAKVYKPDEKYKNYTVDFYPDNPDEIPASGLTLEAKTNEDGVYFRIKRPVEKIIKDELVHFGPPKVFLNTGEVDENGVPKVEPFTKLIGNGSRVTLKVQVYTAGKFVGHRLESVRVDEHVPYEKDDAERPASAEFPF